ncbi:MAG: hypothetical protein JXD22_10235 [Sedimentisphaerales bacterium]|nr:hypothetical protein [Sedimentisphaerales bacterium]
MSVLTKILTLLVSLLAIFLCGIVVVFVTSSNNWKQASQTSETLAKAAQVQAAAAENAKLRQSERDKSLIESQNEMIRVLLEENSVLAQQLRTEAEQKTAATKNAATAMTVSASLSATIDNLRTTREFVQQKLESSQGSQLRAEAQVVELNQELDRTRATLDQLKEIGRRSQEQIRNLEEDNANLRQRLEDVKLASSEVRIEGDQVKQAVRVSSRVPIRGEIKDIRDDRASISIGSSSGVRENMEFNVIRGREFLGNLLVTHVQASEAAGTLIRQKGAIVKGDKVSTGFN